MIPAAWAARLRVAPVAVPCALVIGLLTWWEADGAGFAVESWGPGSLLALGLVAVAVITIPSAWGELGRPVLVAVGALGAFTAWSYASILWSADPGAALEGANRTLLYLLLFSLFALWRLRGALAQLLVTGWVLGLVAIAVVTTVRLIVAADPTGLFSGDRLATPVDYPNAAAATFAMALWPALVLAASARVHPVVRGLAAGGAVLLVELALLTLSRGAFIAVPLTGLVCLALVPGRLRLLGATVIVAVAVAVGLTAVLHVGDALTADGTGTGGTDAMRSAARLMLLGAVLAGAVVGALAGWERARPPHPGTQQALARGGRVATAVGILVALVAVVVVVGNPVDRLDNAWSSFKGGYGESGSAGGSRLTSGLGSNRYDFYRVALDEFSAAPLVGKGVGQFQQAYLLHGRSDETPRYPHSVELRALSQTGLVGSALLLLALGAAGWAGWRGMRSGKRELHAVAGGAALIAATYVFVHGSADWFWETAGLSGPAFAMLGLAAGLCPERTATPFLTRARTGPELAGVAVVTVLLAVVLGGPWLAQRELDRASDVFAVRPRESYARLDRAADLDPLSDAAALLEGSIAIRYRDLPRADAAFARALDRVPDGLYATLQRGAIASARGDAPAARRLLARARRLAPRDATTREAYGIVRNGGTIDLDNLSRRILGQARALGG